MEKIEIKTEVTITCNIEKEENEQKAENDYVTNIEGKEGSDELTTRVQELLAADISDNCDEIKLQNNESEDKRGEHLPVCQLDDAVINVMPPYPVTVPSIYVQNPCSACKDTENEDYPQNLHIKFYPLFKEGEDSLVSQSTQTGTIPDFDAQAKEIPNTSEIPEIVNENESSSNYVAERFSDVSSEQKEKDRNDKKSSEKSTQTEDLKNLNDDLSNSLKSEEDGCVVKSTSVSSLPPVYVMSINPTFEKLKPAPLIVRRKSPRAGKMYFDKNIVRRWKEGHCALIKKTDDLNRRRRDAQLYSKAVAKRTRECGPSHPPNLLFLKKISDDDVNDENE